MSLGKIPLSARPKAIDLGDTFGVSWMGRVVFTHTSMSKAKTVAKHFYGFLQRLQATQHLYQTLFNLSLTDYLAQASTPGNGFSPTLEIS